MQGSFDRKERPNRSVSKPLIFIIFSLAERLLEKETISLPDIVDILGPRPYGQKKQLDEYLEELREREAEEKEEAEKAEADAKEAEEVDAAEPDLSKDPDSENKTDE